MIHIHDEFDDLTVIDDIKNVRIFKYGAGMLKLQEKDYYSVEIVTDKYLSPSRSVHNPSTCNAGVIFGNVNIDAGVMIVTHKRIPGITYCAGGEIIRVIENGKLTKLQFAATRAMADRFSIWATNDGTGLGGIYEVPYSFNTEKWYVIKSYFWRDISLGGYRIVSFIDGVLLHNVLVKFTKVKDMGSVAEFVSQLPQPSWLDNLTAINYISDEQKGYCNNLGYEVIE